MRDISVNRTLNFSTNPYMGPDKKSKEINMTFSEIINFGKQSSPTARDEKELASRRYPQLSSFTYSENMYSIKHLNHLNNMPFLESPHKDQLIESFRSANE